ncbi:helix-turn-helix domain-containing protein [Streptomyces sp. NPDC088785]|uniref:helix-turn-helix domain-containing protein n=1 Tax=Streptomyces sp. NPDC088785 TaxID=3365897 RepID=UPI003811FB00
MITPDVPQFLMDGPLLRRLMKRTGTGRRATVRELAEAAGIAVSTVGGILNGTQRTLNEDAARKIAQTIGVDLLVLGIPCERAGRAFVPVQPLEAVPA